MKLPSLSELLQRLRRLRLAPGTPAGVIGVPSVEQDFTAELAPLFPLLDEIEAEARGVLDAARRAAQELERQAQREAEAIRVDAEHRACAAWSSVLADGRAREQDEAEALRAVARREAERVRSRGRARSGMLVEQVVACVLDWQP